MLKKLVKYGNSNALVLDKALLELLNIGEGSLVKIKTDGVSLIITPQDAVVEQVASTVVPQESLQAAVKQSIAKQCNSEEDARAYMAELQEVFAKYEGAIKQQLAPELAQMDAEVKALSQKYALEGHRYGAQEQGGGLGAAMAGFKRVHEKYRHIMEQVLALNNNAEYIHQSVLLAEKYQATQNSPEYIKEYNQLVSKYVPEYAVYQDELMVVGEMLK